MNPASAILIFIGEACGHAVNMARRSSNVNVLDSDSVRCRGNGCGAFYSASACVSFGGDAIIS